MARNKNKERRQAVDFYFSSRTNPAVQFGLKASGDKSGLQIVSRLQTQLCSGKGTPRVNQSPGSICCQLLQDPWKAPAAGSPRLPPALLASSEEDLGRERRQQELVLTARAQLWALSRYLCLPYSALHTQLLQSFVATADRSKLNAPLLFCFFFFCRPPPLFFERQKALRFFGKASDAIYS